MKDDSKQNDHTGVCAMAGAALPNGVLPFNKGKEEA